MVDTGASDTDSLIVRRPDLRLLIVEWVERHHQPDPDDPAFTVLDELEAEPLSDTVATDARKEPDGIEAWDGDVESFTLAAEPSLES